MDVPSSSDSAPELAPISKRPRGAGSASPAVRPSPRGAAIAAAEKYVHAADSDDEVIRFHGRDAGTSSDSSEASAESHCSYDGMGGLSKRQPARTTAHRRSYLITWPHTDDATKKKPDDYTKEQARNMIFQCYTPIPRPTLHCTVAERHQSGHGHFHIAVNSTDPYRHLDLTARLRASGIYVRFDEFNSYFEAVRYLQEESESKDATTIDPSPLWSTGHPAMRGLRRISDVPRPRAEPECDEEGAKKKRDAGKFTEGDLYDLVCEKGMKTALELKAHAHVDRRLVLFCVRKNDRLQALIDACLEIAYARDALRQSTMTRAEKLDDACKLVCTCATPCGWIAAADEIFASNDIDPAVYKSAMLAAVLHGRGKGRNVFLVGPGNCGKTFLLKPLRLIFSHFSNPVAGGSYPFVGMPGKDLVILNDFRYDVRLMKWSDMLSWLEGEPVRLPMPKNFFNSDFEYTSDAPIFGTGKGRLVKVDGGHVDWMETHMMDLRWWVIQFRNAIMNPVERPPCAGCFARYIRSA